MTPDGLDEFGLIARWFAPLAAAEPGALGLRDDAAVLALQPGLDLVVTTDMVVEGVHFLPADPADTVGVKALGVNLSDLAAMAALPRAYTLSLALPRSWSWGARAAWLDGFVAGLERTQKGAQIVLIGGDTVTTPGPLAISVTTFGFVAPGAARLRAAARPGDTIYVSGTLGDAALGLEVLRGQHASLAAPERAHLISRYREPQPRVTLGPALGPLIHAMQDVSDGLVADLGHIARASGVAARIDASQVPLSPAARSVVAQDPAALATILSGGDDYELLITAPPAAAARIAAVARDQKVPVTPVGEVRATNEVPAGTVQVVDASGATVDAGSGGYRHF